jgi:crossover junction endodeoxyribonuclease RusA
MSTLTVRLPWPEPGLSPNARLHYRRVAELKRSARHYARYATLEALNIAPLPFGPSDRLAVTAVYCPPDHRKRDLFENMPASIKAHMDGVFDALEVNDNQVRRAVGEWGEVDAGDGYVVLTLEAIK